MTTRKDIEQVLWNACDSFRGKIDSSRYKDYILSMLFVKYLSDVSGERRETYIKQYDGDLRRVERAMSRERFAMDEQSTFGFLYANRNDAEIGQKINVALNHIEEHNSGKLRNVFRAIDFNSQVDFGEPKEKNATLRNLLEDFNVLDLRPSQLGSADIIGDAYEYMIAMFASDAGKKGGEFFTPSQVSELVASLVHPKENDRIYDPTCGSGGLLLKAYKKVPGGKAAIYGQEKNQQTWALCTMNMFLHSVDDARIWQGNTLSNPQNIENDTAEKMEHKNLSKDVFLLVDESHRSNYGLLATKMRAVFPHACYIGFTGTPLMKKEKSTVTYPESIKNDVHAQAFYGVLSAIFDVDQDVTVSSDFAAEIAEEITKIVARHSQVDWTNNKTIHDRISQDIDDLFYKYEKEQGFKLSFETIDKIIENVKAVALRRF